MTAIVEREHRHLASTVVAPSGALSEVDGQAVERFLHSAGIAIVEAARKTPGGLRVSILCTPADYLAGRVERAEDAGLADG